MKNMKLTKEEKRIEKDLIAGKYRKVTGKLLDEVKNALTNRKKDYVMTIRLSSADIGKIKRKANRLGVKYQTFISEVLHQIAE